MVEDDPLRRAYNALRLLNEGLRDRFRQVESELEEATKDAEIARDEAKGDSGLLMAESVIDAMKVGQERASQEMESRVKEAEERAGRYREALEQIRYEAGRECYHFGVCDHPPCRSSSAAWMIADTALIEAVEGEKR